jgi:hypothetical protein
MLAIMASTTNTTTIDASLGAEALVGLIAQFAIAFATCAVCTVIFECVRTRLKWVYAPRFYSDKISGIQKRKPKKNKGDPKNS